MLIKIIVLLILLLAVAAGILYYENTALTVTDYVIQSDRLPKEADGITFVVLADLHNVEFGRENERLIRRIDEIQPDFVLAAGDLIVGEENSRYEVALHILSTLGERYPVYYGYGNHEQKAEVYELQAASLGESKVGMTRAEFEEELQRHGICILDNVGADYPLEHGKHLRITGASISLDYFKRWKRPVMSKEYLDDCVGKVRDDSYQILIAHNPMYFESYAQWGADLVVSGHIHGGMVRIPFLGGVISPQMILFPKYDAGLFQKKTSGRISQMIVSRGLGIHTIKIRFLNRPELVKVELKRNPSKG